MTPSISQTKTIGLLLPLLLATSLSSVFAGAQDAENERWLADRAATFFPRYSFSLTSTSPEVTALRAIGELSVFPTGPNSLTGTAKDFAQNSDLTNASNYSPTGLPSNTTDVRITSSTTALTDDNNEALQMESLSVANGLSYTITDNNSGSSKHSLLTLGNIAGFTNVYSGVASDLLFLTGNSTINFSRTGGGNSGFDLALASSGNFNIATGSSLTISSNISETGGSRSITKTGDGIAILSGANTFTGALTIDAGTLSATTSASALGGSGTGAVKLGNTSGSADATLLIDNQTYANPITVQAGSSGLLTIGNSTGSSAVLSGGITLNHDLSLSGGTGSGSLNVTGLITGSNNITTNSGATGYVNFDATNNNATFTGNVTVNSGTFRVTKASILGSSNTLAVNSGATFQLNNQSQTIAGLNDGAGGGGTVDNNGAAAKTLTLGGSGSYSFTGTLTASGLATRLAVTKSGSGTQIFSGASTYGGVTTVSGGKLLVNNTTGSGTGSGSVTVTNNGGTLLGGSGIITGAVSVANGASLAPGATGNGSTAVLRTGALTLSSGSNFSLNLNGTVAGTSYDRLSVTGTVGITGSNLVLNSVSGLAVNQQLFILLNDQSEAITGTFSGLGNGSTITSGGYSFKINYFANGDSGPTGNDISLVVTAVPEASTWAAGVLTLLTVGFAQRRRFAKTLAARC